MRPLRRTRATRASQRGQAVVEFALLLPIVALLLVGILEFGTIMFDKNDVTEAARDGARQAAVNAGGSNADCSDTSNNWLSAACNIAPSGSTICLRALDGNLEIGSRVEVTVTYPYRWVTAVGQAIDHGDAVLNLKGRSVMRIEQPGTNLPSSGSSGTCRNKS